MSVGTQGELARRALSRVIAGYVRLLRVLVYASVVAGGLCAFGVHSARGAVAERSLSLGRELDTLRELLGTTKAVELNGQRMLLSTAVVARDVKDTLDRFEQLCVEGPHALARALDDMPEARAASAQIPLPRRLGILRSDAASDGIIACIVHRDEQGRPLTELVEEVARTLDIGLLGDFFYVYARDASKPGKVQSHVITSWTRGSFRPADMFPSTGDAPGSDSARAARPIGARRVLSGLAVEAPYAVRIYEVDEVASAALTAFDGSMAARGWARLAEPGLPSTTRVYAHETGVTALATAGRVQGAEKTVFSLVEMGEADWRRTSQGADSCAGTGCR